ncbi:hypothetical protein EDD21DRAFT_419611 [Dissophora ornata]|nr:hypothetical protein EDD21DRAFT_419611 [Dissophora ornata]
MRQRLRSPYAARWVAVHNAYVQQGSEVKVEWIKGHAGNQGNEEADAAARQGRFSAVWEFNPPNPMICNVTHSSTTLRQKTTCTRFSRLSQPNGYRTVQMEHGPPGE